MTAKNSLSRPEKIDILKRLVRKFSSSRLSRQEMINVLKRLVTKLSTSRLSKPEVIDILKRIVKKYSPTGHVTASQALDDESQKLP